MYMAIHAESIQRVLAGWGGKNWPEFLHEKMWQGRFSIRKGRELEHRWPNYNPQVATSGKHMNLSCSKTYKGIARARRVAGRREERCKRKENKWNKRKGKAMAQVEYGSGREDEYRLKGGLCHTPPTRLIRRRFSSRCIWNYLHQMENSLGQSQSSWS